MQLYVKDAYHNPMWPWGHASVGYLLWSALTAREENRPPTGAEVVALGVGTQFPDIVDKPLAWMFHVLPSGRSLAHSLLTASVVIAVVLLFARRYHQEVLAVAFGVGYVSHSVSDSFSSLLTGEYDKLTYFLWPLLPAPNYQTESLGSNLDKLASVGLQWAGLLLVVLALVRWRRDGMPGIARYLD